MTKWYFKDRSGSTQGPFGDEEMRAWYEAGFLNADLMISKNDNRKGFKPLVEFFPSSAVAFLAEETVQDMGHNADESGQWYFVDKNQNVQGPFSDIHMRQWHMAGYFEPHLQLMNGASPDNQWTTLQDLFPNIPDAFLVPVDGYGDGGSVVSGAGRFNFPEWLPAPPRYKGVKKVYPSEKNSTGGSKVHVAITDVHGRNVQTFQHARIAK